MLRKAAILTSLLVACSGPGTGGTGGGGGATGGGSGGSTGGSSGGGTSAGGGTGGSGGSAGGATGGGSSAGGGTAGGGTLLHTAPNIVFVTSTRYTANLGGLAGADAICQAHATDAGLPGTYRAWISTAAEAPATRFGGARGWARVDGKPFIDTLADLFSRQQIFFPPLLNENGVNVASRYPGTATNGR